jgi:hypothetical protein
MQYGKSSHEIYGGSSGGGGWEREEMGFERSLEMASDYPTRPLVIEGRSR